MTMTIPDVVEEKNGSIMIYELPSQRAETRGRIQRINTLGHNGWKRPGTSRQKGGAATAQNLTDKEGRNKREVIARCG